MVLRVLTICGFLAASVMAAERPIDFNRDVRSILSNKCLTCHGPDDEQRQAGLRLDVAETATGELPSGLTAIVPGKPAESELIARINNPDADLRMPPLDADKQLSPAEVETLTRWIREGAPYARHWSYVKPARPDLPDIAARLKALQEQLGGSARFPDSLHSWPKDEIDHFILDRLLREGLTPLPEADRYALIRRLSLDLTGLPPTIDEVDRFVNDTDPNAYENLVDRLLAKKAYGEHWARKWLDLARYADSAGYADDPPRTIWAYRDWVIRALNDNMRFDQFTIEQIAGDLLPNPSNDQLIATAFHRNTLTNNEGGTNDEEFRNVAVVDRVNTTMAVWMGTTINCAQCHNHKYDPISQEEYFRFFAIFNNSEDADRRDESPLLEIYIEDQKDQEAAWRSEVARLEKMLSTPTAALRESQRQWEERLGAELAWVGVKPAAMKSREGAPAEVAGDGSVLVSEASKQDVYTVELSITGGESAISAIRLETLPHESLPGKGAGHGGGNFVISRMTASIKPETNERPAGRFVRVENLGNGQILSLAEVEVFSGGENVALRGEAKQSSEAFNGPAKLAIDGNTDGDYAKGSTTHTNVEANPWWEVDLTTSQPVDRLVVWNRTDNNLHTRLANFRVALLDESRQVVWEKTIAEPPNPSAEYPLSNVRPLSFAAAYADHAQQGFEPANVLAADKDAAQKGWAVGGAIDQPHQLTLVPSAPAKVAAGDTLIVTIEQVSPHENHTLGHFRLSLSGDPRAAEMARTPAEVIALARTPAAQRSEEQQTKLTQYYLGSVAPELSDERGRLADLKKQLAEMKPATSVPIMRALPEGRGRKTHVQHRGNFLELGKEVTAGLPGTFHAPPEGPIDRLSFARWLVSPENPLTARVVANRYWEAIFGQGIVVTSEEFGSQGELPSHPELLDWLATELVRLDWDVKAFLRLIVTSAAYRQSSRVTPELLKLDPANRLSSRGPRFRLSAETIRDQALAVSGLLSDKMYGPPARPPQPKLGVSAAFGGGIDWKTSEGEDRYRRGIYTTWRRSNPYPSMATFDAPNREVCTVRRDRTNTPLQALVTLNDPVYVECAQSLARQMVEAGQTVAERATHGFRCCLARPPTDRELQALASLYESAYTRYSENAEQARRMATSQLGPPEENADLAELAAWTVVGNVLLNLDEMFLKR